VRALKGRHGAPCGRIPMPPFQGLHGGGTHRSQGSLLSAWRRTDRSPRAIPCRPYGAQGEATHPSGTARRTCAEKIASVG